MREKPNRKLELGLSFPFWFWLAGCAFTVGHAGPQFSDLSLFETLIGALVYFVWWPMILGTHVGGA